MELVNGRTGFGISIVERKGCWVIKLTVIGPPLGAGDDIIPLGPTEQQSRTSDLYLPLALQRITTVQQSLMAECNVSSYCPAYLHKEAL